MNTPYIIAHKKKIVDNYLTMCSLLPVDKVFYATKPNIENITFQVLAENNAKFEVVSSREMHRLIKLGVKPCDIICSVPIKPIDDLRKMYMLGCRYFVYDCLQELEHLNKYCKESKKILRLSVHDFFNDEIGYGMCFKDVYELLRNDFIPDGYTFYVLCNDDLKRKEIFEKIFKELFILLSFHQERNTIVNIGGNFKKIEDSNSGFYNNLKSLIDDIRKYYKHVVFYAEPGRAIVQDAFDIITTVLLRKDKIIYIDAHSQIIKIPPLSVKPYRDSHLQDNVQIYMFHESLCSNYALFESEINFNICENMKLILEGCGAYATCFANRFHSTGYPKLVVVED